MKKVFLVTLVLLSLMFSMTAYAEISRAPELDAALSLLEKGNPILVQYNSLTGAGIVAPYEYGVPYFFGGKKAEWLMKVMKCREQTRYYDLGKFYVYGFDCSGFTKWINVQSGKPEHDSLSHMMQKMYKKNHLDIKDVPLGELYTKLEIGDFLVAKQRARHILMYIGTMRDYGYAADTAPELGDYLDYPLVIQCGKDPFHSEWYTKWIESRQFKKTKVTTTDGGVCVSILGIPAEKVPHKVTVNEHEFQYFDLGGYKLTLYDLNACRSYVWFRMDE